MCRTWWALKWEDWGRNRGANYCRFFLNYWGFILSMMVGMTGEGRVCGDKWSSWFGGCFGQVKVTKWRLSLKWSTQYWMGLTQGCKCWDAENQVRSMRTLSFWKWQGAWRTSNCKGHAEKEVAGNVKEMRKWNRQSVAPWSMAFNILQAWESAMSNASERKEQGWKLSFGFGKRANRGRFGGAFG